MSTKTSAYFLIIILTLGIIFFIYILIKDRIDIIRSIKPNSLKEFFGFYKSNSINVFGELFDFVILFFLNIFGLFIWVPFWILDKLFNLGIFKDKKSKK